MGSLDALLSSGPSRLVDWALAGGAAAPRASLARAGCPFATTPPRVQAQKGVANGVAGLRKRGATEAYLLRPPGAEWKRPDGWSCCLFIVIHLACS